VTERTFMAAPYHKKKRTNIIEEIHKQKTAKETDLEGRKLISMSSKGKEIGKRHRRGRPIVGGGLYRPGTNQKAHASVYEEVMLGEKEGLSATKRTKGQLNHWRRRLCRKKIKIT